jgi:hypothetical protein
LESWLRRLLRNWMVKFQKTQTMKAIAKPRGITKRSSKSGACVKESPLIACRCVARDGAEHADGEKRYIFRRDLRA